jgi:prepilin-type N-terminal cleavage/methylation domain-containing protein
MSAAGRAGVTLVELLVALLLLGILGGTAALTLRSEQRTVDTIDTSPLRQLRSDRTQAMTRGIPITSTLRLNGVDYDYTALANGAIISDVPFLAESLSVPFRQNR